MTKHNVTRVHPVAKLFPLLDDDELAVLAESIKQNGLLTPITRDPNGVLLDGRNRLKACEMAGVEPRFEVYDGDAVEFILSKNIARRHLTVGQRMIIIALACPEAEKGGRGKRRNVSILEKFSPSRLSEARTIIKHSRDLALEVVAGSRTFKEALDEATIVRVRLTYTEPAPSNTTRTRVVPVYPQTSTTAAVVRPSFVQQRDTEQSEPEPARMEDDPVEQWLVDWPPDQLKRRIFEADRLSPGYARKIRDAISEELPPTMH